MKITCPRCGGAELLNDLGLIQTDLYYSRGRLHGIRQADSPNAGPPPLSCDVCKGQGWVTTEAYPYMYQLHQVGGFWVLVDPDAITFEGHFWTDPTGYVVIRTDLNQGVYPKGTPSFITLI